MVKNISHILHRNELLSEYQFDWNDNIIHGTVAASERAMDFLSGRWLEQCIRIHVESFLNLSPRQIEYAQNIHVIRPDQSDGKPHQFELDALLAVDNKLYWWEAKCGQYTSQHTDRYAAVARELALPPEQCFLILGQPPAGTDVELLGKQIGFRIIQPQDIPAVVEEIEADHRRTALLRP
jgi:hypothetical protein